MLFIYLYRGDLYFRPAVALATSESQFRALNYTIDRLTSFPNNITSNQWYIYRINEQY